MGRKQFFRYAENAAYRKFATGALAGSAAGILALCAIGLSSTFLSGALALFVAGSLPAGYCVGTEPDGTDNPALVALQAMAGAFLVGLGYFCIALHLNAWIALYAVPAGGLVMAAIDRGTRRRG